MDDITLVAFLLMCRPISTTKKIMPLAAAFVVFYVFYQTHHMNDYDDKKARLGHCCRQQAEVGDQSTRRSKWLSS